jgi:hypothetical protein
MKTSRKKYEYILNYIKTRYQTDPEYRSHRNEMKSIYELKAKCKAKINAVLLEQLADRYFFHRII